MAPTAPALASMVTVRSMAASIPFAATTSSQISRPSGLSHSSCRSAWMSCRAIRSPVGQCLGPRHAAEAFVHEAQLALQVPDEGDGATIQLLQVDAAG